MPLPLEGVTVLDFTSFVAGPYCSMILGDMGADVIKVEAFPGGDTSRAFDPKINGESYCFSVINRNKRSLAIDLKSAEGKKIVMALAKRADVVTENFRPGVAKRLGIDYESLKESNPGLVYCSLSGFGQTGPYSSKGGYDIIAQGMSGAVNPYALNNGVPNWELYAMGFNPSLPAPPVLASGVTTNGYLVVSYTRNPYAAGYTFTPQESGNLSVGFATMINPVSVTNTSGGVETVVTRGSVPISATNRQFLRVRIAQPTSTP